MKKLILPVCLVLLCGCASDTVEVKNEDAVNIVSTPEEEEIPEVIYSDDNPIKLSLYLDRADESGLDKSPLEYKTTWIKNKDIVVFGAVYSEEESLKGVYFQNIWKDAASKYEDYSTYKMGWTLEFSLKDGTKISQRIQKPSDVEYFYDYLEIYMYDSVNVPLDTWYSHMLDEKMTDSTILTSMKLTAGSLYEEINSPIVVTAFTYNGEDDFDENGLYRGDSFYRVTVINNN